MTWSTKNLSFELLIMANIECLLWPDPVLLTLYALVHLVLKESYHCLHFVDEFEPLGIL